MEIITYEIVWRGDMWRLTVHPDPPVLEPECVPFGMKRCSSCGEAKRLHEFPARKNMCKPCRNDYFRAWKQQRNENAMPLILESEGAA